MSRDRKAPTVVIVHGAWVDGTSWREVIALLHVKGVSVIAELPERTRGRCRCRVTRHEASTRSGRPRIGRGDGGTVITQAGGHSNVAALVYIAAYTPDIGESTTDVERDGPSSPVISRFEVDAGGFLSLTAVQEFLAHDLSAAEVRVLAASNADSGQRTSRSGDNSRVHTSPRGTASADRRPHDRSRLAARDRHRNRGARPVHTRRSSTVPLEAEGDGSGDPRCRGFCGRQGARPVSRLRHHPNRE